jgi:hypothetical protein
MAVNYCGICFIIMASGFNAIKIGLYVTMIPAQSFYIARAKTLIITTLSIKGL